MGTIKGQSTNKAPLFNGTNYTYWKATMKTYVQANDYDSWKAITQGIEMHTTTEDGEAVPKSKEDFDEKYTRNAKSNAKAMNLLYCVLSPIEFNRISSYHYAK